jgi:hypothetical protein
VFWLVVGREVIAVADAPAQARLIDRVTGRVVAELTIPAGGLVRKKWRRLRVTS